MLKVKRRLILTETFWAVLLTNKEREFKFPIFRLPRHPTRMYLYSIDVSKLLGFRDTYIFFLRNPNVKRINGTEADRNSLSETGLLPSALRNRPITFVRARDVFREFGHKVINRGKPIKDDYFVGDEEYQNNVEQQKDDDEMSFGENDYSKGVGSVDKGPFRRHTPSLAGFPNPYSVYEPFEPVFVPQELKVGSWDYKCALSAADFNSRLLRNRPVSFLDLHTNIEQIPRNSQPLRVLVEKNLNSDTNTIKIDSFIGTKNQDSFDSNNQNWEVAYDSDKPSKYPISIMRDQYQEQLSL
jgi:hypothetical protein